MKPPPGAAPRVSGGRKRRGPEVPIQTVLGYTLWGASPHPSRLRWHIGATAPLLRETSHSLESLQMRHDARDPQ